MGKLIWKGLAKKDSPVYSGNWIFGGKRLTDVVEERKREKPVQDGEVENGAVDPEAGDE